MSGFTLTNTSWGELYFSVDGGSQVIRTTCKACGVKQEVILPATVNPFTVKPLHKPTCRFVPAPIVEERAVEHVTTEAPPTTSINWKYVGLMGTIAAGMFSAGAWLF